MILIDANVLIYAHNPMAAQHDVTRRWLEAQMQATEPIGIPWAVLWAFLRVCTNRRVNPYLRAEEVFETARAILDRPNVRIIDPGPYHLNHLEQFAVKGQSLASKLTDAVLAALAIEHGATLASTDRDFARFPGLKWINPLDAPAK